MLKVKKITSTNNATVEYSSVCPFNSDNTGLLVLYNDVFGLHYGDGKFYMMLPSLLNAHSEPRWSRSDPHIIYFVNDNKLMCIDLARSWDKDAISVLYEFSEYKVISGKGESDISKDGKYLVFIGDNKETFQFNLETLTKELLFPWSYKLDSLYLTDQNDIVVSNDNGIFLLNKKGITKICRANGHKDILSDYLIWTNSNDPAPLDGCPNGIIRVNLNTLEQKCLLSLDWKLAVDISCSDDGVILVSTYDPTDYISGYITQLNLDGQSSMVCLHKSKPLNKYNWQPRASISRDGSRFVFNSNEGLYDISNVFYGELN